MQNKFQTIWWSAVLFGLLTAAGAANASSVVIQEVLYDGAGADSDDAFTELYGTAGLVLDNWSLVGVNGSNGEVYRSIDLSGVVIPGDGVLLIATASANAGLVALRDVVANVDWQNGPDAVQLRFGDMLMDSLQYGDAGIYNAGEGAVAVLAAAGESLSRDLLGSDSDNNAVDFLAGEPSAGRGPSPAVVPVPAAAWLMLSGLGMLGLQRRRGVR